MTAEANPASEDRAADITMKHTDIATPAAEAPSLPKWPEFRHPLRFPVTAGDADPKLPAITEIVLREPDVEALERIDDLGLKKGQTLKVSQIRVIIAALARLPDAAVLRIHRDDFSVLAEQVVPLLGEPGPDD